MEVIAKIIYHANHHLASMVVLVYQQEIIHFGNVFVQHYILVKTFLIKSNLNSLFSSVQGTICEVVSLGCSSNPCRTGTCISLPTGGYQCLCPPLITGINCDTPLLPCSSNPCLNNATCLTLSLTNFTCICPPLYTGLTCAQQIIVCTNNLCQGNSTCIVNPITGVQVCQCPPQRYGV